MATLTDPNIQNMTDPDEVEVEEVHCAECNVPMPAIPAWYAKVNVRFTCDNCRQKSPGRLAAAPAAAEESATAVSGVDLDLDGAEDADEDVDAEMEEDDASGEAEE